MSLRKKLYLSFMVMILLVVCTSAMSMLALWKTDRLVVSARAKSADVSEIMVPANHLIAEIYTDVNQASLFLHAYSFSRLPGDHEEGIKNIGQIRGRIARLDEILKSPRAAGLARSQKDIARSRTELESLAAQAENLHGSMLRSDELQKQIDAELAEVNTLLNDLYDGVIADITAQLTDQAAVGLTPLRERLLKSWGMIDDIYDALAQAEVRFWQGRGKYGEEAAAIFSEVEARLAEQSEKLRALLGSGLITAPEALAKYGALADHLARYASLIKDFSAEWRRSTEFNAALAQASATLLATFDQLEVVNSELSAQNAAEANGSASAVETLVERSIMGALITLIASMVAGAVLAIVITRGIVNPIGAVISSLAHSEAVIGEAAAQLNSTSRDLSEGVTVQASSLDAAASALDQMSAMVKTSAENSKSTDLNTAKTSELVKGGAADMREMSSAMSKINEQADKISNIIKTIEEIAFQTNLLALNASVEAARAGEAGKGFAVVAEEVRNLSARSAQAAKDTTDMITATVTSVRDGSSILDRLSGSYNEIETGIGGIQGLIGQIARALEEQSHGVEQVNIAVSKMNGITRQNAAGAGNSALSAHNLEEQITDLRADVATLRSIISGQKFGPNAIGAV